MSKTIYPVILVAQASSDFSMRLIYSEEEQAAFYSKFEKQGTIIKIIPAIQTWFREKMENLDQLYTQILQKEGFGIVDPALYKEQGDYTVEKSIVYKRANKVFGDEKKAARWLNRKNKLLNNKRPADLCDSLHGLSQVNSLLLAI